MLPMQPGDVPATFADVDDLMRDVGFAPTTSIEMGVAPVRGLVSEVLWVGGRWQSFNPPSFAPANTMFHAAGLLALNRGAKLHREIWVVEYYAPLE